MSYRNLIAGTNITLTNNSNGTQTIAASGSGSSSIQTYTPTLSFSGGSTGIIYGIQTGFYITIGKICFFSGNVSIASKGSDSGIAQISLPIAASSTVFQTNFPIWCTDLASTSYPSTYAFTENSINYMLLEYGNGVTAGNLVETDILNNTSIIWTGFYFID